MNVHKRIRLTPHDRKVIWGRYRQGGEEVTYLAEKYRVTPQIIYKVLARDRKQVFKPRNSTNDRYRALKYGLQRLARIETKLQAKLKSRARRYNKSYPGELMHSDTKRLPILDGESATQRQEHLFVAIDDFSREFFKQRYCSIAHSTAQRAFWPR